MVRPVRGSNTDRGQLLLIGAISLAFILLGVVIVFNSVQYTETINSGSASEDIEEIRTVESEIKTGLKTVDNQSVSEIDEDDVEGHILYYRNEKSKQKPTHIAYVDGTYGISGDILEFDVTITTNELTVRRTIEVDLS